LNHVKVLEGLTLWDCGRAASLLWLQFGEPRELLTARGGTRTVGSHALHVQCAWDLRRGDTILVGSEAESLAPFVASLPASVQLVKVDGAGRLELVLDNGLVLDVHADSASDDEQWRLLRPGTDIPHFVVGPGS
jgi:hypothetical protein